MSYAESTLQYYAMLFFAGLVVETWFEDVEQFSYHKPIWDSHHVSFWLTEENPSPSKDKPSTCSQHVDSDTVAVCCPLCKLSHPVPIGGFPANHFLLNLAEIYDLQTDDERVCVYCQYERIETQATARCVLFILYNRPSPYTHSNLNCLMFTPLHEANDEWSCQHLIYLWQHFIPLISFTGVCSVRMTCVRVVQLLIRKQNLQEITY